MSARNSLVIDREAQPTLRGYDAVVDFCRDSLGVEVTASYVKSEKQKGTLEYYLLSNKVYFAPKDVVNWIQSLRDRSRAGRK